MNRQRRDGRSRRGAALIEFVMIIPMLAMIIGLTFFFGWTMGNRLHVRESSRYAAWRHVRTKSAVGSGRLNEAFYDHRGTNIGITRGLGTEETIDDLITAAGTMGSEHATFADSVIWGCGHQGRTVRVRAKFPSEVGLYRRFQGRLASYHARDGRQWRREDDLTPEQDVRDVFLSDLDQALYALENGGSRMAKVMRITYLNKWGAWPH